MLTLRQRQARPALRPGDRRCRATSPAQTEFQGLPGRGRGRRQGARHQRQGGGRQVLAQASSTKLTEFVKRYGAKGLAWVKVEGGQVHLAASRSSCRRRSSRSCAQRMNAEAGRPAAVRRRQGGRRLPGARQPAHAPGARRSSSYDPAKQDFKIAWVVDFPSFIWDDEEKRWAANHHPFTAPMDEDLRQAGERPGQRAGEGVRPGHQRLRVRRRQHSYSQPGGASRACSRVLGMTRGAGAGSASASCSTRSSSARRRTAASRWASTAGA